jgi:hypothetical protein
MSRAGAHRAFCAARFVAVLSATVTAEGQIVSATVDILGAGEPGYDNLPANLLVVDYFVDVAETDVWTAAGTRVLTENGATLVYADGDPNTPGLQVTLTDPGLHQRYTTFVSRPRGRDGDARFTNSGAAVDRAYGPAFPPEPPETLPTLCDPTWFRSPPATSGMPSQDGYIARIAIDLGPAADRRDFLLVSQSEPPDGSIIYARCVFPVSGFPGWTNATYDVPSPHGGIDWYLFDPVPEPATSALLLCGAGVLLRMRRR